MALFYTGKGDKGESDLGKGKKADKTCVEMVVLGDCDELNSLLGLIRSQGAISNEWAAIIRDIQEDLFIVQANIAATLFGEGVKVPLFMEGKVKKLEVLIDEYETRVNPERGFVIPGETEASAWFDYARAVSRRVERSTLELHKKTPVNPLILSYMNRLSSILFALGRLATKETGTKEFHPRYK